MTRVGVYYLDGAVRRVSASGHTGYAESGSDIVCAALSAILETALMGLGQVAEVHVTVQRDDEKGYLEFSLPEDAAADKMRACQIILKTMLAGVTALSKDYACYIRLEEKQL